MKKIILTIILFALPFVCFASFNIEKWQYYKDISIDRPGLIKFSLDDEMFSNSKNDLSDMRIIDNNGNEAPYKLAISEDKYESEKFYPKMLNNSYAPGVGTSVILEFQEGQKEVNQLKIITPADNFQRNVKIYGSDDKEKWNIIKADEYIYDYTDKKGNFKSQNTTLNFPLSIFKYIKIEIADSDNTPIFISSVEAVKYVKDDSKKIERQVKYEKKENSEEKTTEILVDLGSLGIPTNAINLNISDENFNRGVLIYSGADINNLQYLNNGYIFRYGTAKFTGENLKVEFPEINDRYIKMVIQNKDDRPLDMGDITVLSIYREVIFNAKEGNYYKAYYGNEKANFPEYDLNKYFDYLDLKNSDGATISAQKENPSYVPDKEPEKPLSERIPYLMPSALVIICLALLGLVYRFLRK
ncbi:MAG: DUF3999 family protein [bacterium]